ncbi:hypothetical protein FHS31_000105 [Sphingomonas vulcanisoli]|uniref:Ice-binding protein C-terminal domain-containing protein n=1 Tax=Sphingomonas vulcanisoli TaxID=1658060 RepID=A0ABX0TLX3_9SPHN|nr:PEPxxWA-CTERM sorting domain-containing protein [Sphingomonas vulcanisoli]NIJ06523.1 hypothetical protein [Sphingomonas vulcanisoli]
MRNSLWAGVALLLATPALAESTSVSVNATGPNGNQDNYSYNSQQIGNPISIGQTYTGSAPGEIHVSASISQGPSNGSTNYYRTAAGGWNDGFSILSPTVSGGSATVNLLINGSNAASQTGGFGASIAFVRYDFYDTLDESLWDPSHLIAEFSARDSVYTYQPHMMQVSDGQPMFGLHTFDIAFSGNAADIGVSAFASCTVSASLNNGASSSTNCDLAHSTYWMGVSSIQDANGNAIGDATIQSEGSFSMEDASPNAPGASVPEPASWALIVLGFGAIGLAVRRRRNALPALR